MTTTICDREVRVMGTWVMVCRARPGGSNPIDWEDCWTCARCGTVWSDDDPRTCDS